MKFLDRIREGFVLLVESGRILLTHPSLLLYFFAALTLNTVVQGAIAYAASFIHPHPYFIEGVVATLTRVAIVTFFCMCLAHHTLHILRHKNMPMLKELHHQPIKAGVVAQWSLLASSTVFVAEILFYNAHPIIGSISTALLALVFIATVLVIPILANEDVSVARAIRLSFFVVKSAWVEIVTGVLPIMALSALIPAPAFSWKLLVLMLPYIIVTSTLMIVFCTVVYYEFYRRPLEEVDALRNPEF